MASPTITKQFYASSLPRLKLLKEKLALRTTSRVVGQLLAELADDPAPPAPNHQPTPRVEQISQVLDVSVSQQLVNLQRAHQLPNLADVVAWLLELYDQRHASNDPPPTQGEQQFAAILAYITRREKAERAARKAARKAAQAAE